MNNTALQTQQAVFDNVASRYEDSIPPHVMRHYIKKRLQVGQQWWPPGSCVLDVGCGTGRIDRHFALRGYHIYGADGSMGMLQQAATHRPFPTVQSSVDQLPFLDDSFDGAITIATLHHVIDRAALNSLLCEMVRVTKPGGHMIIWDHNPNNIYWYWLVRRLPQDAGGVRLVSLREILRIVRTIPTAHVAHIERSGAIPTAIPKRWLPMAQRIESWWERCWGLRCVLAHNVVVLRKQEAT
jgi:ubiquinone/menaquinone biosynthesis C-methylase UbiE